MTAPVFLSSRWVDGAPRREVGTLDRLLRQRGVPVWRDVRALGAGAGNEEAAHLAITESCSGAVFYFTEDVFESWFIGSVELEAIRRRLDCDPEFFVAAVFDRVDGASIERLRRESGVDVQAFGGLFPAASSPSDDELRSFARGVLGSYLARCASPSEITVDTRGEIPLDHPSPIHLNWSGVLGDDRVGPADDCGEQLKPAIGDLQSALEARSSARGLRLGGQMHLSAAFLIGWQFREPSGWTLDCEHPRAATETRVAEPDPQGWANTVRASQNESETMVVRVAVSQDPAAAILRHRASLSPPRAQLTISPPGDAPGPTALEGTHTNALVATIRERVQHARSRYGVQRADLYLACPWTFAVELGWMSGSLGELAVHEATADKSSYHDNPITVP